MMSDDSPMPSVAARDVGLRRFASLASLTVAVVLVAVKLAAWILTRSIALLTSAVDGLVDAAATFATYFGVRYAARPPDREHRFGHGKGEAVAGFTQATFLAGAALALCFQSAERLASPEPIEQLGLGMVVVVVGLLVAIGLVAMQTWVVRQTGSTAIAADRAHYFADVAVNVAVLFALGVTRFTGWDRADPVFALGISGYMLLSSYGIAIVALKKLLDRELPTAERRRIKDTILACSNVRGLHDLRTRYSGDRTFVEFHLELDCRLTIARGHAIGDAAEDAVRRLFLPAVADVTAHLEPAGIVDDRLGEQVAAVSNT